jgi:3-dehydroquinate synthase
MSTDLPPLPIHSGQGDYQVTFPTTLADLVSEMLTVPRAIVVIDSNVAAIHAEALAPLLSARPTLLVPATEEEKTPAGVNRAWEFFQKADATKQTNVIVLGGGIIQDIAQFAAHNYYRGLRWHFAPTTLLGQADSCIGAKCGINLGPFKNQLGVFHSPSHVWICLSFLETLSDVELCSGYGEIVKLHLTRSGPELFRELASEIDADGWRNPHLARFIRQSLEVKKGVIEEDEYEKDLRRILNYGHTFGHALEAITNHGIPHGVAVAWGMDIINFLAWRRGLVDESHFMEVHGFIARHFAWKLPRPVTATELINGTRRDKKVADGKVNLVLPDLIGGLSIIPTVYDESLNKDVADYLASYNVVHWD